MILAIFSGALLWTLMEYVLHRFLGHVKKKFLVRTRFHKEHSKHHLKRHYFAGALDKFLTLLATTPIIFLVSTSLTNTELATSFTISFAAMYLIYEMVHYRMHVKAPPHAYASKMRAHHFYHHFVDENMNHGVTTPLWDIVFGTYRKPATITLSQKFCLPWLKFDENGAYRDNWGQRYHCLAR